MKRSIPRILGLPTPGASALRLAPPARRSSTARAATATSRRTRRLPPVFAGRLPTRHRRGPAICDRRDGRSATSRASREPGENQGGIRATRAASRSARAASAAAAAGSAAAGSAAAVRAGSAAAGSRVRRRWLRGQGGGFGGGGRLSVRRIRAAAIQICRRSAGRLPRQPGRHLRPDRRHAGRIGGGFQGGRRRRRSRAASAAASAAAASRAAGRLRRRLPGRRLRRRLPGRRLRRRLPGRAASAAASAAGGEGLRVQRRLRHLTRSDLRTEFRGGRRETLRPPFFSECDVTPCLGAPFCPGPRRPRHGPDRGPDRPRSSHDALEPGTCRGPRSSSSRPDGVVHLKGYGVRESARKTRSRRTPCSPWPPAPRRSRPPLLACLADEGKLAWDDPVRKHLPDFRLSDPAADALVTLRDLPSHRTGVGPPRPALVPVALVPGGDGPRAGKLPLVATVPDRTMQYQSVMYIALGQAAAKARAASRGQDLVRERLLKPAGDDRRHASPRPTAAKQPDRAAGHRLGKDGKLDVVPWYEQPDPNPAGSVNATARDLAPWLRFQLTGGAARGQAAGVRGRPARDARPQTVDPPGGPGRGP